MTSESAHALISRACVNDCVFCTVADKRAHRQFPKREQILSFIEQSARDGVSSLVFSGLGEPTLDRSFDRYLARAEELGFERLTLFTNGYRLTPERARRYRRMGLTHVLLSMHGLERGHDANVQRPGSFAEACAALDSYIGVGIRVSVNTCLTRLDLEEIPGLRALLQSYPIERHVLSFPEWSGNALTHPEHLLDLDEVVEAAPRLLPEEDGRTYFENVPYCQVLCPVREMLGESPVRLLDGGGVKEFSGHARRKLPGKCEEARCPLLDRCPGFEAAYLEARGWGGAKERASSFLDAGAPLPSSPKAAADDSPPPAVVDRPTRAHSLVCVPWGTWVAGHHVVAVRVRSAEEVADAKTTYGVRIHNFEVDLDQISSNAVFDACAGYPVRIRVSEPRTQLSTDVLERVRRTRPLFVVPPDRLLRRTLNVLSGLGFLVHVDPDAPVGDAAAPSQAAEYFLSGPLLTVPIEPFYSLLGRLTGKGGRDLWVAQEEVPGRFFWVGDNGEVSLSRRWLDAGESLGRVKSGRIEISTPVLAERVKQLRGRSGPGLGTCGQCSANGECRGYLKAVDPRRDCEPWKRALDLMRTRVAEARELEAAARTSAATDSVPVTGASR